MITNKQPLVSIFMPVRNGMPWIKRALESVLSQTWHTLEIIVQDGDSDDGTLEYLQQFYDRISLVSEKDTGPDEGFLKALNRCQGDIIGSCMSDEALCPDAIEKAVTFLLENPLMPCVVGITLEYDLDHKILEKTVMPQYFDLTLFLCGGFIPHFPGAFYRRNFLERIGFYEGQWGDYGFEYEFWLRMACEGPIGSLNHVMSRYGRHDHQLSITVHQNTIPQIKSHLALLSHFFSQDGPFGDNYLLLNLCHQYHRGKAIASLTSNPNRSNIYIKDYIQETISIRNEENKKLFSYPYADFITQQPCHDFMTGLMLYFYKETANFFRQRGQVEQALFCYLQAIHNKDWTAAQMACSLALKIDSEREKNQLIIQHYWLELFPKTQTHDHHRFQHKKRLKIGYLCSSPLKDDVFNKLIFLEKYHKDDRYSVILYLPHFNDLTQFYKADKLYAVGHLSVPEFRQLVLSDTLDILITLAGFDQTHHFTSLLTRLAPLQINFGAHLAPTKIPTMDWIITDSFASSYITPEDYTEHILPWRGGASFCIHPSYERDHDHSNPFKENDSVLFGSFNDSDTLQESLIYQWSNLLHECPHSKLLISHKGLEKNTNREFITRQFKSYNIDSKRLILKTLSFSEMCDPVHIILDSWPYSNGAIIAQALMRGIPAISMTGIRLSSLSGATILHHAGCDELIAKNWPHYIDIARDLSKNCERLKRYHRTLRQQIIDRGLCDPIAFVRTFELNLETIIKKY
jgi:predicted O-linked N-acetylglucosamine transferase (SPINDLY family)